VKQRISLILVVVLLFMMSLFGCKKAEDSSASTAEYVKDTSMDAEGAHTIVPSEQIEATEQPKKQSQEQAPQQLSEEQSEAREEDHTVVVSPEEESPEEQTESTIVTVPSSKEKPLYLRLQEAVEAMPTIVKKVEYTDGKTMERLTEGVLGDHFDYEIYYYGIKNFYIEVNGKTVELRDALATDPKVLDLLYAEWNRNYIYYRDNGYDYMFKDGGTLQHNYSTYDALKYHSVSHVVFENGEVNWENRWYRDLCIGIPEMTMNEVESRFWIDESAYPSFGMNGSFTWYNCKAPIEYECYLGLREADHHFMFKNSAYSNYLAQGTYTLKDSILTLKTNDPYQNVYLFRKVNNGFTFVEEGSSEISAVLYPGETEPIRTVSEGSYFELRTE